VAADGARQQAQHASRVLNLTGFEAPNWPGTLQQSLSATSATPEGPGAWQAGFRGVTEPLRRPSAMIKLIIDTDPGVGVYVQRKEHALAAAGRWGRGRVACWLCPLWRAPTGL
jgi:hypothetical protein